MKYAKQFLEYFQNFPSFTVRDARIFFQKKGADGQYYKIFMHNLIKSGKAFTVARGAYTLHDDPMAAGFAFSPFYYGMETALTYYKLWDYVTPISIITTRRVRRGSITLLGRNASIRRIKKDKFFGYSMVQEDGIYVPMADIEKTMIDSVYFHSRFSKDVYVSMAKRIDRVKMKGYLRHYSGIVNSQVNGLLN